jgi:histidinol-phosphate/aromatic aminotransferase/cobyric acid decarboxylase-like protein
MGKEKGSVGYVTSEIYYDGHNGPEIDLGLGTSPIGPAPELRLPLKERDPFEVLSSYPDPLHREIRSLILKYVGLEELDDGCVVLDGNGSYGVGDEIIRFLSWRGHKTLIVPQYSFPNVAQWAARHRINYQPLITEAFSPLSSWERIITLNDDDLNNRIVYIDYPNNPFGITNFELIKDVINKCSKAGATPLVDLAFGEVLGEEFNQVIRYTIDNQGIALCSLSKTQGLPGLRTGYAIISPAFNHDGYNGDQRLVFGLNSEAEFVYKYLFRPKERGLCLGQIHAQRVAQYNTETNQRFYEELNNLGLNIAQTDLRTPIQVIISDLPDFYQRLAQEGVKTESLDDYKITLNGRLGYSHSAVRILTPRPGELEEVLRRIKLALR